MKPSPSINACSALNCRHCYQQLAGQPAGEEVRTFEFELQAPASAAPGLHTIPAYALYYVCEGRNGTCLYRRQDIEVPIEIKQSGR